MIHFFENFNATAFSVAELILYYFGLFLPFFITVVLFGALVIGGILCLVDWIKETIFLKKLFKMEFDTNENNENKN